MIEKMKVVHVIVTAEHKAEMLDALRELGIVHFAEKAAPDDACAQKFSVLSHLIALLEEHSTKKQTTEHGILQHDAFNALYSKTLECAERKAALESRAVELNAACAELEDWGSFSPAELKELAGRGIELHICRVDKKTLCELKSDPDISYIRLFSAKKQETVAIVGTLPAFLASSEFCPLERSLEEYRSELSRCNAELSECERFLCEAAYELPSFRARLLDVQNEMEYSSVSNTSGNESGLVWLSGYIPISEEERFRTAAMQEKWAWALTDADDDDELVPTKVKYNRLTKIIAPVFDILGTVPGYHEYDISFWFLGFFTLFCAMILGDAGYGCIFLIAAAVMTFKAKKAKQKLSDAVLLLWVLSVGTIIWGALTGTWFGLEGAMQIPLLKALVIPSFANYPEYFNVSATQQQNTVMKFCFILGTLQLSLACVMNIRTKVKVKDLSLIADFGWLCAICALYFVVLYLVIGQEVSLAPVAGVVVFGFLLVILFGGMSPDKTFMQGLKAGLADFFTTFLNTISAFGNIMSYIRLFAVGMASLAIAQSFNNMALGFEGPLIVFGLLIMIIGHALNIVMGLLSVVVHGVRLNLLEFSGQLGMEWTGIAYSPFKKSDKLKK